MTVLSVLRSGPTAAAARASSTITIASIKLLGFAKSGNLNQLIRQDNCLISLRHFGGSGGKGHSGIRVSEFVKSPAFREFKVAPSKYAWQKFKDLIHFYFMLGFIPCITIVFLVNVFIGPPTLAIPEPGYIPKHWEHQRHPITQFLSRYVYPSYQESYERNMFYIREEDEKRRMRLLAWKAEGLMRERGDFYNYYGTKTVHGKTMRQIAEENRRVRDGMGHHIDDEHVVGLPLDR